MKWLPWLVLSVIGLALPTSSAQAAFDGPGVVTYDKTQSGIRIVLNAQGKLLVGNYAHFRATITAPVSGGQVGQQLRLELMRYLPGNPSGDQLIDDSCTFTPTSAGTANFSCDLDSPDGMFRLISGLPPAPAVVEIYPRVKRAGSIEHDPVIADYLEIEVIGDDANEPNNTPNFPGATPLSPVAGLPVTLADLVHGQNNDYFTFVAPGGVASADVTLEFWNQANDLDLYIYNSSGVQIGASPTSADLERVIFAIAPGQRYFIGVEFSTDTNPSFYDLALTVAGAHTVTGTPSATPPTVASGGVSQLAANGVDTLGHALTFEWIHQTANCPANARGTFSSFNLANPTWTAPVNNTGSALQCRLQVTISDGIVTAVQRTVTVTINPLVHGLDITAPAAGTPNPAPSGGAVALSVTAVDTLSHSLTYAWSAVCTGGIGNGSFDNAVLRTPVWTAPANGTGSTQTCSMSVTVNDGNGLTQTSTYNQSVLASNSLTNVYYFAEGATIGGFFETRLALLNAEGVPATVSIDFQLKDTTTVLTHILNIPAHSRATIDVSKLGQINPALTTMNNAEFSTVVRSNVPLVADRTMTWDGNSYGSHGETSVSSPASTWYLAEGATIGNFELYYLIQNPNNEAINFTVTYLLPPPAAPIVRSYPIGANTRTNIPVHLEPGLADVEVSAIIESPAGKPVIVERAMYLTTGGLFYGAGHESAGIKAPATQWFFAEGATGDFFDLFILIGNPGATPANITATFLFDDGTTCATTAAVDPKSRFNIWVDTVVIPTCPRDLANAAVSTTVTSDVPVIAERAMWWPGPTAANWAEAHNAAGATSAGTRWGLADGEQGGTRSTETYILIANTSAFAGLARLTLYFEDGSTQQKDVSLPPNSRTNVAVGAPSEAGGFGDAVANKRFGTVIQSVQVEGQTGAAQIVVERAMYSNGPGAPFWAAGTDVLATRIQ